MAERCGRGEDAVYYDHMGTPCRDTRYHRRCSGRWRAEVNLGKDSSGKRKPRLRCPGNQKSQTVQSMQQGALQFSQGAFMAIRNPAIHQDGGWNPVTAAEHLAALSIVARWVRHWDVVHYVPPLPPLGAFSSSALDVTAQQTPRPKAKVADK